MNKYFVIEWLENAEYNLSQIKSVSGIDRIRLGTAMEQIKSSLRDLEKEAEPREEPK